MATIRLILGIILVVGVGDCYGQDCQVRQFVVTPIPRMNPGSDFPPVSTPSNFKINLKSGGLRSVSRYSGPTRVVLVVDIGNHQSATQWASGQRILKNLSSAVFPDSQFFIVTFTDRVEASQTVAPGAAEASFAQLRPVNRRSTEDGLLAGLSAGLSLLKEPRSGDAEVFLSNVPVEAKHSRHQEAVTDQFISAGVRVFGVVLASPTQMPDLPGPQPMTFITPMPSFMASRPDWFSSSEMIAAATGGMFLNLPDVTLVQLGKSDVGVAKVPFVSAIANQLQKFYVVNIDAAPLIRGREEIKMALADEQLQKSIFLLLYPHYLFACSPSSN